MTYEKLKTNKAVVYARFLGFELFDHAANAIKHYHWYMPETDDTFSISIFGDITSYTVNRQSTTNLDRACEWLREVEHR
jgi:hypothetical protein